MPICKITIYMEGITTMNFLNRLERKIGRYAIPNLMYYVVLMYLLGVILSFVNPYFYYEHLCLNVGAILQGEIWRVITFLICPPSAGLLFNLLMMYLYYSLGTTLERTWGTFRFNIYFLMGILGHIAAAFVIYALFGVSVPLTTYYLNESLFLAFAATFPDMVFNFFGIIPIKAKWLGYVIGAQFLYHFVTGGMISRIAIGMSLLNFVVFFLMSRDYNRFSPSEISRRNQYQKAVKQSRELHRPAKADIVRMRPRSEGPLHRCEVCGRTEKDDPSLEFRYCSKCAGSREYCMDHLYTHEHVTEDNGEHKE